MRRRSSGIQVNMFPFLSVLCSVIGILMLFILSVIGTRVIKSEETAKSYPGAAEQRSQPESISREEADRLKNELAELEKQLQNRREELQQLAELRRRLHELLALKVQQRETAATEGVVTGPDIGPFENVKMAPLGEVPVNKKPQFVEVGFEGYTVHPEGKRYPLSDLPEPGSAPEASNSDSTPMQQFLKSIDEKRNEQYLVFLVRPNGAPAFDRIYQYLLRTYPRPGSARLSRIDIGWEPFAAEWLLLSERNDQSK